MDTEQNKLSCHLSPCLRPMANEIQSVNILIHINEWNIELLQFIKYF